MKIKYIVLIVIIGFILFDVIEHLVLPLVFYIIKRKKQYIAGVESMPGEVVDIRQWNGHGGQVFVKGERWKVCSEVSFKKGDKTIIQQVEGLTLKVKPIGDGVCQKKRKNCMIYELC
jgi:membrane-bound ClpP family serine protease